MNIINLKKSDALDSQNRLFIQPRYEPMNFLRLILILVTFFSTGAKACPAPPPGYGLTHEELSPLTVGGGVLGLLGRDLVKLNGGGVVVAFVVEFRGATESL